MTFQCPPYTSSEESPWKQGNRYARSTARRPIVTGAASGIGKALAEELAGRRCDVVLADLQLEEAEEAAESIRETGGKATAALLDVTDPEAFRHLVRSTTVDRKGRLDYLFNNAGIGIGGPVFLITDDDWKRIVEVNLGGVIKRGPGSLPRHAPAGVRPRGEHGIRCGPPAISREHTLFNDQACRGGAFRFAQGGSGGRRGCG